VFTQPWADLFLSEINASGEYRTHGAHWDTPIALEMSFTTGGAVRAVVLDLHRGNCRSAACRVPLTADNVGLVIRASVAGWKRILAGRMDPVWGIMSGQLQLVRGNLTDLIPYARAAKALVDSAARIDATFPPPEGP